MTITINGNGTVTGVSVGGLPDGIVDNDMIANTTIAEGKLAANVNTITHVDQWRLTSNFTGDANPLSSNLERIDTAAGVIGSPMTQSSGVFSFPVTGIWRVEFNCTFILNDSPGRFCESYIYYTTNDSSYTEAGRSAVSLWDSDGNTYGTTYIQYNFDITNVSTHKVKFTTNVIDNATESMGDTNRNFTYFTFTRLGDT